jgi:hypothetical protein
MKNVSDALLAKKPEFQLVLIISSIYWYSQKTIREFYKGNRIIEQGKRRIDN